MTEMMVPRNALTAAPARVMLNGVAPPGTIREMKNTITAAPSAPDMAIQGVAAMADKPNTDCDTTTAKAAPVVRPSRPGSASGLRVTPCMRAPASDRLAPTTTASMARGRRRFCTMT